jgi:protein phosphatase
MAYKVEYFCVSHTGKCRKNNQDNFYCNGEYLYFRNNGLSKILHGEKTIKDISVFGVFDGMGGEECGEMASYLAAECIAGYEFGKKDPEDELIAYCRAANADICRYTEEQKLSSMGTTAAILLLDKKRISLCNVGDSRIFRLSRKKMQQISYDHVSRVTIGKKPPLTQNLGIPEEDLLISPYTSSGNYRDGDIYLICSDGLTDMLDSTEIAKILALQDKKAAVRALLQQALDNGGKDNVSFIVLYIEKKQYFTFGKGKE